MVVTLTLKIQIVVHKQMASHGLKYFGVGVSGGEEGALKGPSIMPFW